MKGNGSWTHSIRDSETSIDFVQGPPGSRRERIKSTRGHMNYDLSGPGSATHNLEPILISIKEYLGSLFAKSGHSSFDDWDTVNLA